MSQYRSHGYLFNHVHYHGGRMCEKSQYRSHGYLFNQLDGMIEGNGGNVSIPFSRLSL